MNIETQYTHKIRKEIIADIFYIETRISFLKLIRTRFYIERILYYDLLLEGKK